MATSITWKDGVGGHQPGLRRPQSSVKNSECIHTHTRTTKSSCPPFHSVNLLSVEGDSLVWGQQWERKATEKCLLMIFNAPLRKDAWNPDSDPCEVSWREKMACSRFIGCHLRWSCVWIVKYNQSFLWMQHRVGVLTHRRGTDTETQTWST